MLDDTIAAVATPPGRGGIGVLRVSGPDARHIALAVFRAPAEDALQEPARAIVVDVVAQGGEPLDRAVAVYFAGPRSYTGEDVVEISCHGNPLLLEAALHALFRAGARAATPGEFTLRAFLNGRIDLTQAEAVRDLVDAQTLHQARRAQRQLRGELSRRLAPVKARLLDLVVHLESTVEFVDDDIEPESRQSLVEELESTAGEMAAVAASYRLGRLVSEGVGVALAGPVNAGKSSIFNALVESERAIVTDVPGTTRDLVSEQITISGLPVRLVDTAGLRETDEAVERIGIERTRGAIADADVVLAVVDVAATSREAVEELFAATAGLRRIVVANKTDLAAPPAWLADAAKGDALVAVSARTGDGVDALREAIVELASGGASVEQDAILVTNARHHALLASASAHLASAADALAAGWSEEVALVGLHGALGDLGEVTGETAVDDILNRIFSTFCIGK
jgi:tRNA modification GTPase